MSQCIDHQSTFPDTHRHSPFLLGYRNLQDISHSSSNVSSEREQISKNICLCLCFYLCLCWSLCLYLYVCFPSCKNVRGLAMRVRKVGNSSTTLKPNTLAFIPKCMRTMNTISKRWCNMIRHMVANNVGNADRVFGGSLIQYFDFAFPPSLNATRRNDVNDKARRKARG